MSSVGWFAAPYAHGLALLAPLSILMGVMGILCFIDLQALDAVIFFGGAGLFWSERAAFVTLSATGGAEPASYAGWYAIVWAVYFFCLWLGAFRQEVVRMLFLFGTWLTLLAVAIGFWGPWHVFMLIGGYLGLITAVLAAIVSARAIIETPRP